MSSRRWIAAALALVLVAGSPRADEVRTADGRVLVGTVVEVEPGVLEITTRTGKVRVRRCDVVQIRTEAELRRALRELDRDRLQTPFHDLQVAKTALSYGLEREMWRALDQCLERLEEQEKPGGRVDHRLRAFLATLEPEVLGDERHGLQGDPGDRVGLLLERHHRSHGRARRAAAIELLVRTPNADVPLRWHTRRARLRAHRQAAVQALARLEGHDRFVYRTAILDEAGDVRRTAVRGIRRHGDTTAAVRYLAPGLLHDVPAVRIRTARAFAGFQDREAVPLLVMAGPLAGTPRSALQGGGAGVRAHMSQLENRSYIRDFDVEIAQAAAVANPVIDQLRSGVVLDATVAAVTDMQVEIAVSYRRALQRLVGDDPGPDPKEWRDWLVAKDPELAGRTFGSIDGHR